MKLITALTSTTVISLVAVAGWTTTFITHPLAERLEIVPELNGPDYIMHYSCEGEYVKMKDIHMVQTEGTVAVNYGALGRRREGRVFSCK